MANSKFQKYGIYINSDLTIGLASKNYPKSIYYSPKSMHRIKSCKLQMFPILAFEYGAAIYHLKYLLYISARHISVAHHIWGLLATKFVGIA